MLQLFKTFFTNILWAFLFDHYKLDYGTVKSLKDTRKNSIVDGMIYVPQQNGTKSC